MADVLDKQQRKYNMSRILGKNTGPELKIRKLLWSQGIRGYRIHYNLPGKPDIVFTKKKITIFIDGCFWHKCPVCFQEPETRKDFWMKKINSNVERDAKNTQQLQDNGWTVMRFWEHEIRKKPEDVIEKITLSLQQS
ncbi:MAG: very short patch repair endonuclease [Methanoregula sp.]|jgi:DNA mismatch endonuclease (patch repair protein)|uniref:very short patch repair endonuclease n=1 Tax=Methanoregula sp. TaxID=2052170 RepID=UPI003C204D05